jgi:hypothetical protein
VRAASDRGAVRRLDLTVAVAASERARASDDRARIEREVLPRLLAGFAESLRAHFGAGAIVAVKQLRVSWRVTRAHLEDADLPQRLGRELAGSIIGRVVAVDLRRPPSAWGEEWVVFTSRAEQIAASLIEAAEDSGDAPRAWRYPRWDPGAAESLLLRAPEPELEAVLVALEESGHAGRVVESLSPSTLSALSARLASPRWPAIAAAARRLEEALARPTAGSEGSFEAAPPEGAAIGAERATRASPTGSASGRPSTVEVASGPASAEPRGKAGPSPAPALGGPQPQADPGRTPDDSSMPQTDPGAEPREPTGFAGLFYLVGPILELDLAQHLWCAGAAERAFLLETARLLAGDDLLSDPAAAAFAGVNPGDRPRLRRLPAWADAEVREKSLASLEARLRRRLDDPPGPGEVAAVLERAAASLPPAADPLALHLAAAVCTFFNLRRGRACDEPLADILRLRGRLLSAEAVLKVVLPMEAIDLDLRRAGLDFNPGWVPWLERRVEICFV